MSDLFEISIDYTKAIMQAAKLTKTAGNCRAIKNDISKQISFIEENWKGKAGESLACKLKELNKKNSSIADNIDAVAQTMKNVANSIRDADQASIDRITGLK